MGCCYMYSNKLEKVFNADEGNFYDKRDMDFEKDKEAATDDYGLSRVPGKWRFSPWQAFWSLTGLATALAFPLTGAQLAMAFGVPAVIIGFLISAIIVGVCVYYTAKQSSKEGTGKDLMGRASFGYLGSVFTSLFSAIYFVLLFSLETSVLASSLSEYVSILPYWVSAALIVLVFILIGIYGMVFINKLQNVTLWLYAAGLVLVFIGLFYGWSDKANVVLAKGWWKFNPPGTSMTLMNVLSATGVWLGAMGLVGIFAATDVTRMVRRKERKKGAILSTIIFAGFNGFLAGLLGVFLLASTQFSNTNPGVTLVWVLGSFGLLFAMITQLRINVMNMYLGTLAFDSSIGQISNKSVSRGWLLIPFAVIGYVVLIIPGFLDHFSTIATFFGPIFAAWVGSFLGERILVRRRYGIPAWSEFRRAYLPTVNWIGFSSLIFSSALGIAGVSGVLGSHFKAIAVLVILVISFFLPTIIAGFLGKERVVHQYFARIPEIPPSESDEMKCPITGDTNHRSDFVLCPFHDNTWISSKACATESNCGKMCQSDRYLQGMPHQTGI